MNSPDDRTVDHAPIARSVLDRALRRARGGLLWERLWPALTGIATVAGLFLAFSWAGLWLALPPLGRAIALGLFALVALASLIPLARLRLPSINDGLRRLDQRSGETHRPASAIADELPAAQNDPVSQALWRAHIERALQSAKAMRAGWPSPNVAARDPIALRALVLFLVVASFFAAKDDHFRRIAMAFDWHGVVAPANYRIDAWINPPVYTARPPVMLPGLHPGETATVLPHGTAQGPVSVPAGSQLVIRATGDVSVETTASGGVDTAVNTTPTATPKGVEERQFIIKHDGALQVRVGGGNSLSWSFKAIADLPPTITVTREPERQARGALRVDYKVEDDYGVVDAKATFARVPPAVETGRAARPLFEAPSFNLVLPQARARNGVAQTIHDLSEHPWAGTDVMMTLIARDEAGNEGRSEAVELNLPQRIFVKPVARALIEQRRNLALDANARPLVEAAIDALTIAPEKFTPEAGVFLGLRSLYYELVHARNDDALRDVVARMWAMAVQIEDGNVSDAEQALRQAQDALRQALERGASEEELKQLMDQLRAALDKFMQALTAEMRKNPQQLSRPLDRNTRTVSPQDLKSMIDRMEQFARSGNKDAARRMLEQLQQMLENLQSAQRGGSADGDDDDDMMSALNELGDVIRKQQQLRDKTFREGQEQEQRGQRGQRGQDKQRLGDLRQDQQALRDRLNKLLEQLRQRGLGNQKQGQGQQGQGQQGQGQQGDDEDGQGGQAGNEMGRLGEAGEAMDDAQGLLGEGNSDGAVDSQGRALDALRKGAQSLAQTMQQNGMMGPGPGQPGRNGQQRAQQDTDPLGRPLRGRDYGDDVTVKVPGEIDAQRARRILEELRRRFADPARPQIELDYIERLLKDF